MQTPSVRKFTFDNMLDFDPRSAAALLAERAAREAAEPSYGAADLLRAREEGFEAGCTAALAEAERSETRRLASAVNEISRALESLVQAEASRASEFRASALGVALAAVRKLCPELARRTAVSEAETLIRDMLAQQIDEPRIVVRLPDGLFDVIRDRLDAIAAEQGFAGKIVLAVDPSLGPADLRVEWPEGGVERLMDRATHEIERAIVRMMDAAETASATDKPQAI